MAKDEAGRLIDPFGGEKDLREGVLRHVSAAFAEDPVRILRVARFAARFGFRIAPETEALMRRMVRAGEADHLVAERVWQEFSRGLMEKHPARMFEVLERCGLSARVMPEIRNDRAALERAAAANAPSTVRFAVLTWALEAEAGRDARRAPARAERGARARGDGGTLQAPARGAGAGGTAGAAQARRRDPPARALRAVAAGRRLAQPGLDLTRVEKALAAAASVDAGAIAQQFPQDIATRLDEARRQAIARRSRSSRPISQATSAEDSSVLAIGRK